MMGCPRRTLRAWNKHYTVCFVLLCLCVSLMPVSLHCHRLSVCLSASHPIVSSPPLRACVHPAICPSSSTVPPGTANTQAWPAVMAAERKTFTVSQWDEFVNGLSAYISNKPSLIKGTTRFILADQQQMMATSLHCCWLNNSLPLNIFSRCWD